MIIQKKLLMSKIVLLLFYRIFLDFVRVEPHFRWYDLQNEAYYNEYVDNDNSPFDLINYILIHFVVIDILQLVIEDLRFYQTLRVNWGINGGLLLFLNFIKSLILLNFDLGTDI